MNHSNKQHKDDSGSGNDSSRETVATEGTGGRSLFWSTAATAQLLRIFSLCVLHTSPQSRSWGTFGSKGPPGSLFFLTDTKVKYTEVHTSFCMEHNISHLPVNTRVNQSDWNPALPQSVTPAAGTSPDDPAQIGMCRILRISLELLYCTFFWPWEHQKKKNYYLM